MEARSPPDQPCRRGGPGSSATAARLRTGRGPRERVSVVAWRIFLLFLTVAVAGCAAEYWARPGGTPVQFGAEREACARQAEADFPPRMEPVVTSPGTPAPFVTRCAPAGAGMACSTTGVGLTPAASTTLDRNIGPREQALRSCLQAAGWRSVRSQPEAEAIANSVR